MLLGLDRLTTSTLVPTAAATHALVTGGMSVIHCSTGAAIGRCRLVLRSDKDDEASEISLRALRPR